MISILVLFLLGVASSKHCGYYDNDSEEAPMISKKQEDRICAELCSVGLGGEPCGDSCFSLIPRGIPTESQSGGDDSNVNYTRKDACPVLCANQLGYPLCGCDYTTPTTPFFRANFLQVCSYFCERYDYQIYGCTSCDKLKNMNGQGKDSITGISSEMKKSYDWNTWCIQQCQGGDGGSACYCDMLPLSLQL